MLDTRENIKGEIRELLGVAPNIFKILKKEFKVKNKLNLSGLQELSCEYQRWYTKALAVVRQLMPDRLSEFEELYRRKRQISTIYLDSYTISDFLLGVEGGTFDVRQPFITKFNQQLAILKSAYSRVDSILSDITGVLRADLFDSEIEKSRELLRANYLRAAGTIAGVVLESHLSEVCKNHSISFAKKILHISDYNEALKQNKIYDTPTWRLIQRYNDIRIMCCHAKDREPTQDEVGELIDGVEKAIKTIL